MQTVQVEGSSNNTITLNGLRELTTYSITVRAYQQLLGPASTISVFTHCQQEGIFILILIITTKGFKFLGIYLAFNGNCFSNGSYFPDSSIRPTPIECVLPGATLNGGQWIGPNGVVPCDGGNNANVRCTTESGASLSVHINPGTHNNVYLQQRGDGWYKCCLPTNCSDPNTNIIFANIFSKRRL